MPTMGYPFPPFPFLPPPYPSPHPMGYQPPHLPGPSHKSTKRENQCLQNQVQDLERQLKKQQPKRPRRTSPWRRKRSRSRSPERNTRPRKHFTVEVARSVKRPGHRDPHNTPGYNKQPRWLSEVHLRPSPQLVQVLRGKVTIMLEPDPPANPHFGAYRAPTPPKPNEFWPLPPRPDPRPQPPRPGPSEITGGGYGLARSRRLEARPTMGPAGQSRSQRQRYRPP